MKKDIILLIHCDDQKGIIADVTNFIQENDGNITYVDQHVDLEQNKFFMRIECAISSNSNQLEDLKTKLIAGPVTRFNLKWRIYDKAQKPKMALFVSKYDHCLYDILGRYNSGELGLEIPFILSNHEDLRPIAESFNIPYYHVPVYKNNKTIAEQEQLKLLEKHQIDFIVLARYMQIISPELISVYPHKIINIHHSFLPAFVGAKPYHSAYKRGMKIIGATSHYVTEELDAGPIIEQDVARVSHTYAIKDLITKGRDLEKIVLANALKLHTQRKVMVYNNKTVIFS